MMRFDFFALFLAAAASCGVRADTTKPSIVIVPGAWQIPPSWTNFTTKLENAGYETSLVTLPSVGISLTGLDADRAAAQAVIDPLLEDGKEVVILSHSLGGFISSNAVEDRGIAARSAAGKSGGVIQLIYLAAFMAPVGYSLYNLMGNDWFDWMVVEVRISWLDFAHLFYPPPDINEHVIPIGRRSHGQLFYDN